ncbi:MMPL family transporter, partial [Candidatus Sumerlaeota bacterium]|nr:MMPL family transporter [Candidatus Sumerlaeota bacterium]
TAIGFFAFIGTAYAGVSELGLISGVGMFLSMMISLTVLPAILTIFPLPNPKLAEASRMNQWSERASAMPELHSDKICYVAAALAVASMFVLHKVRFDYDPINLRDPKSESVSTLREVSALGGGASQLSITALAPDEAAAVKTADAVAKLPSVARVMTIRSFVPENQNDRLAMIEDLALMVGPDTLQSSAHDDPKPEEQIGAIREFAAKLAGYLKGNLKASDRAVAEHIGKTTAALLTRLDGAPRDVQSALLAAIQHDLLDYLPASLDSLSTALGAHTFTLQDLPADLKDRWINAQGEYRIEVSPKQDLNDPVRLRTFVNEVLSVAPTGTDSAVDVYASGRAVIKAFQQASIWAILAIVILLFIVFRNVRDALLVMVPLLLAGLLTCGATVIFKVPFNFANVIALPLLLGVGVDNGIHIVQRMRESARRGPESAPRKSVSGGVFYSALTTLGAFANLAFASHPGMASLGKIHTISISLGLICVLVVLPALVHRVTRRKSETET